MARKKTKYTFVYRLETANGEGPYRGFIGNKSYFSIATDEFDEWSTFRHPTPFSDSKMDLPYDFPMELYNCGFANLNQYFKWMFKGQWRKNFEELGLYLNKYKVALPYVEFGSAQVVFKKNKSELVASYSPNYVNAKVSARDVVKKNELINKRLSSNYKSSSYQTCLYFDVTDV